MGAGTANKSQQIGRETFEEFAQNSTVHGVRNVADSQYSRPRRILWVIVLTVAVCGLLYTHVELLIDVAALPTVNQQSVEILSSLPFPAVTLCSLNKIPKSLVENNDAVRQILLATSSVSTASNITDIPYINVSMYGDYIYEVLRPPIWPTLPKCSWKNVEYNCEDLFVVQRTDFGYCYTFNGKNGTSLEGRSTVQPGSIHGLAVHINIQQDEYILSHRSEVAGMRVLLHDPKEKPFVDGRGFDVSPGTATKGSLSLTKVKHLAPPYRTLSGSQCVDTATETFTNTLENFDTYEHKACIYECRYKYVKGICNCRSLYDLGDATLCDSHQLFRCYHPHYDEFMNKNLAVNCDCPLPCEWDIYKAEMSIAAYPSSAMIEGIKASFNVSSSNERFRQDFLKLTLAYDNLHMESVTQVPKYTRQSVVSSVGGQMGMFIGASALSLIELLEFVIHLIVQKFSRRKKRKITNN